MERIILQTASLLSDMLFCGIDSITPDTLLELNKLSSCFSELGMNTACMLINSLCDEISAFKRHENNGSGVCKAIYTLEFYLQSVSF